MDPEIAIEFGQEAVLKCLTLAAPILIVGIVIAIVLGILQSMFQVQDQTVSFVPKIVLIALTFMFCLPWIAEQFVDYSRELLEKPQFISTSVRANRFADENGSNPPVADAFTSTVATIGTNDNERP